jgi:hypothetical protein
MSYKKYIENCEYPHDTKKAYDAAVKDVIDWMEKNKELHSVYSYEWTIDVEHLKEVFECTN